MILSVDHPLLTCIATFNEDTTDNAQQVRGLETGRENTL